VSANHLTAMFGLILLY